MLDNEKIKIINFIQDFGCCTLKHLKKTVFLYTIKLVLI